MGGPAFPEKEGDAAGTAGGSESPLGLGRWLQRPGDEGRNSESTPEFFPQPLGPEVRISVGFRSCTSSDSPQRARFPLKTFKGFILSRDGKENL